MPTSVKWGRQPRLQYFRQRDLDLSHCIEVLMMIYKCVWEPVQELSKRNAMQQMHAEMGFVIYGNLDNYGYLDFNLDNVVIFTNMLDHYMVIYK